MALTLDSLHPIFYKYDYMRTDYPKEVCGTYLSSKNPFNLRPKTKRRKETPTHMQEEVYSRRIDWHARARGLYYHYTPNVPRDFSSKILDTCDPTPPVICRGRTRTRCTQTRYRESSAQTRSYQPEVAGDKEIYKHFEVYQIAQLLDTVTPPGEYETKVVERHRRRLQFQKALDLVPEDKEKQRTILEAMYWEDWIAREEDIQNCQMLRMEIVTQLFKSREEKMHADSEERILETTERIQIKRLSQLKKINVAYARGMRRLEWQHQKIVRKYHKENITIDHTDPASDLHAPQMRFGVNPNRRHFVGFKKHFNERVEDLEKRREERSGGSFKCPFAKLRSWAKPKERMKEVTQRFCSDENLKNLYESLKGLRTLAEAPKPTPLCLKVKTKPRRPEQKEVVEVSISQVPSVSSKTTSTEQPIISHQADEISKADELGQKLQTRRFKEVIIKGATEIDSIIAEFEDKNLGKLLKFLNDELIRLKQLKKFQAIHMLARKERWRREAYESGLRQRENSLREQKEEIFETSAQVHKDTACLFLESVLEEEFEYTCDDLASQKILQLAKNIDSNNYASIMMQDKERRKLIKENISDYIHNQILIVAEKALAKQQSDSLLEHELRVMEEELFAAIKKTLEEQYSIPDSVALVSEILDEIIGNAVVYDFAEFTPDTSDDEFHKNVEIKGIINQLIKLIVPFPNRPPVSFYEDTDVLAYLEAQREAKAVMRKLVRRTITEQRWKNDSERVVEATVSETFNNAVYEVECLKASRIVRADDRLHEVLKQIYKRLEDKKGPPPPPAEVSEDEDSPNIQSIPSAFDIFDRPSQHTDDSDRTGDTFNLETSTHTTPLLRVDYVDPRMLNIYEPPVIDRRHERFDIMGRVAKRWQKDDNVTTTDSEESVASHFANVSYDTYYSGFAISKMLLTPWVPSIYPELAVEHLSSGKRLSRSFEREEPNTNMLPRVSRRHSL